MKSKIKLRRITHRGESRIAILFTYDSKIIDILKSSLKSMWSNTNKCWYVDDNETNLKKIFLVFHDIADIDISEISSDPAKSEVLASPVAGKNVNNYKSSSEKEVIVTTDKIEVKRAESKSIQVNSTPGKIVKGAPWKRYGPVVFTIDEADDKLIIKFTGRYDPAWIDEIRSFGRVWFDEVRLEWIMDWTRLAVDSLSEYFSLQGVEVIVKKNEVAPVIKDARQEHGDEIRDRDLDSVTMDGVENVRVWLNEKRYSIRTIESYISLIILFFKYVLPKKPSELTQDDIVDFFHDYVLFHRYSASYQNQIISGLKIYFMLNGKGTIDSSALGRPRRSRALPKVFSKDEVKSILNSARNMKHRLILWMIYSCGLRRSEVTNIKLTDLDRERGILNIREAKGKVDRFVPVPQKVWEKIDEYTGSFHPAFWLFEGQTGGRYSSESVYRVFKQALKNAGIKKEVGVHSLRHSYATHLHESGLDIRYIQELLGHKSTRTTEIYTHVSRRNLIAVRSPIEDMDVK